MKVKTKKSYPFRSFFNGRKRRVAFYVIEVIGDEPRILIYSEFIKNADYLSLQKSELEDDQFRAMELLEKYLPKELAEAVFSYAQKDLKCKKRGFSLKSYVKWKESRQKPRPFS